MLVALLALSPPPPLCPIKLNLTFQDMTMPDPDHVDNLIQEKSKLYVLSTKVGTSEIEDKNAFISSGKYSGDASISNGLVRTFCKLTYILRGCLDSQHQFHC